MRKKCDGNSSSNLLEQEALDQGGCIDYSGIKMKNGEDMMVVMGALVASVSNNVRFVVDAP